MYAGEQTDGRKLAHLSDKMSKYNVCLKTLLQGLSETELYEDFCLKCFDCGAIALIAFLWYLRRKVLGNS